MAKKRVIYICDEFGVWDCDYEQKCRQNTIVEAYIKSVARLHIKSFINFNHLTFGLSEVSSFQPFDLWIFLKSLLEAHHMIFD